MPYSIGEKGSHGCSGYPVIKTKTGEVMGCHPTTDDAQAQLAALHINEPDATKSDTGITPTQTTSDDAIYPGVGIKRPSQGGGAKNPSNSGGLKSKYGKKPTRGNVGRSGDATGSAGSIASGGPGGSMGAKSIDNPDIWVGSAFSKRTR